MIFWCHVIYTLGFVVYLSTLVPPTLEEYVQLSKRKQRHFERGPYAFIMFYYLFVIMNYIIRSKNPDAFDGTMGHQFLTATFGAVMFWGGFKERKLLPYKFIWVLPVTYFFYTLKRNWAVMKTIFYIFDFLLAEIISLVPLIFLTAFPFILSDMVKPKTAAEEERIQQELEVYRVRRKEEKERKRQEKALRLEQEARRWEAEYSNDYDDDDSDDYASKLEEKGKANYYGSSSRTCNRCEYFKYGQCTHAYSEYYDREVWNPDSTNCGHFIRR